MRTPILIVALFSAATLGCVGEAPLSSSGNNGGDGGGGSTGDSGARTPDATPADQADAEPLPLFSFFVTSLDTMRAQSGSVDGFGGDLGGLAGADQICQTAAEAAGGGGKVWRAFLSTYNDGNPIHAIDRIGAGPWYDKNGRLIANNIAGLLNERPDGDPQIIEDLPDETGVGTKILGDTHDILTGSNAQGQLETNDATTTCQDWTSALAGPPGVVRCGHAWPRTATTARHWIREHTVRGCEPGVNLEFNGGGTGSCVGCGGGWGGIYCFALTP